MPYFLPSDAQQYIVTNDPLASVRNLTGAIGKGLLDLSVLKSFINASTRGETIAFTKSKPIPLVIYEHIRARPDEEPRKVVYQGLAQGLWSYEDTERWEENAAVLSAARKTSVPKGRYLTRKSRPRKRLARVSDMFVPKMAMDIVCSHDLCDGAKACMGALLGLAGKENHVVTFTSSLATMLGRTARTVRNYLIALEERGLITRSAGSSPNTVKFVIHSMVRPEPYVEPTDITAFKLARRSSNPDLRNLARTVAVLAHQHSRDHGLPDGRRKQISAFNPESVSWLDRNVLNTEPDANFSTKRHFGPTTHSNFEPFMRTDRSKWAKKPLQDPTPHELKPLWGF